MTNTTWLYTILDGETVRMPFDLDTFEADWLRVEKWAEPPSKVNDGKIIYDTEDETPLPLPSN